MCMNVHLCVWGVRGKDGGWKGEAHMFVNMCPRSSFGTEKQDVRCSALSLSTLYTVERISH